MAPHPPDYIIPIPKIIPTIPTIIAIFANDRSFAVFASDMTMPARSTFAAGTIVGTGDTASDCKYEERERTPRGSNPKIPIPEAIRKNIIALSSTASFMMTLPALWNHSRAIQKERIARHSTVSIVHITYKPRMQRAPLPSHPISKIAHLTSSLVLRYDRKRHA
ncbi:hypothetical protein CC78DRAFT_582113 [Lojkania enalia]|uniref:Uncharacterized protein n=1 Tax=Lojkania enalia TaxID=147567 RepID=A0A9P4K6D3_9PLEO|nr:hypothetical protein CC78DRAFT_582113 [Didymosphaeria enalia]